MCIQSIRLLLILTALTHVAASPSPSPFQTNGTDTNPVSFRGRIEPLSVIEGKAWNVLVEYADIIQGTGTSPGSKIANVPVDDHGIFEALIPALSNDRSAIGELRFSLVDSGGTTRALLFPITSLDGYGSTIFSVPVPLAPNSVNLSAHMTTFNAQYTDKSPLGCNISVHSDRTPLHVGDPVALDVTLTNTSDEVYFVFSQGGTEDYRVGLRDSIGRPVPLTEYGLLLAKPKAFSMAVSTMPIRPGAKLTTTMNISKSYVLNSPGTFRIVFRRHVETTGDRHDILSPEFTFVIDPR